MSKREFKINDVVVVTCSQGDWRGDSYQKEAFGKLGVVTGYCDEEVLVEHEMLEFGKLSWCYTENCITKTGVL